MAHDNPQFLIVAPGPLTVQQYPAIPMQTLWLRISPKPRRGQDSETGDTCLLAMRINFYLFLSPLQCCSTLPQTTPPSGRHMCAEPARPGPRLSKITPMRYDA